MKLVSTLKEGTTSSLLAVLVVKLEALEKTHVMDVEETFFGDPKEKALASAFSSVVDHVIHS